MGIILLDRAVGNRSAILQNRASSIASRSAILQNRAVYALRSAILENRATRRQLVSGGGRDRIHRGND
jgi:hypothetical protein